MGSAMTLSHREYADVLEKESKRSGLPDGWSEVLTAACTSIRTLADELDAHLADKAWARDAAAARYRWLRDNVQPFQNDNEKPHALIKVCVGEVRGGICWFDLIATQASVGVVTLDQAVDKAMAAGRGEVG